MTFDTEALLRLLPATYRSRDAQLAEGLMNLLAPADAAELLSLQGLPTPTLAQRDRLRELGARAALCVLTPAEVVELAALAVLPAPTVAEQARTAELREKASRGPLKALLMAFAREIAVLEENVDQLYDDLFIETCADWVIPYIGDLLGSEPLHRLGGERGLARAEVAHTVALRRRKGTAGALEQLARDLTGWGARAVEYFELLGTTQYVNHIRSANLVTPSMRDGDALERVGSAFDLVPHRLDVRRIVTRRGRHNIPNVGIFLWRVGAHRLRQSPARRHRADATELRFRFSPLGNDTPLFTRPEAEVEITHLAEPVNVPAPISRRVLRRDISRHQSDGRSQYYGPGKSLFLQMGENPVLITSVVVCNLSDTPTGWAQPAPPGKIAVDPELGRFVVADDVPITGPLRVTYHYGAVGDLGGGEYVAERTESPAGTLVRVPGEVPRVQDALDALGGAGVVEITDSGIYEEALVVAAAAHRSIELRAAVGRRPTIILPTDMALTGGVGSSIVLSGLLLSGRLEVPAASNELRRLRLVHSTLVPGGPLGPDGAPLAAGSPSLVVARPDVDVVIDRSIVGPLRVDPGSTARITDSIVDACAGENLAYVGPGGDEPAGGELSVETSTIVGAIECRRLDASNSLLLGRAFVTRRQEGCVLFSYLPLESSAPRRFASQPTPGPGLANHPRFTSLRYGAPAYGQLSSRTPLAVRAGADDESEMGAFHYLYQPQREANLATRLEEYLRVGLEAGIFYES